jgi:hypothetical protein
MYTLIYILFLPSKLFLQIFLPETFTSFIQSHACHIPKISHLLLYNNLTNILLSAQLSALCNVLQLFKTQRYEFDVNKKREDNIKKEVLKF